MSFGSAGIGSSAHLAGEEFGFFTGIEAARVPTRWDEIIRANKLRAD